MADEERSRREEPREGLMHKGRQSHGWERQGLDCGQGQDGSVKYTEREGTFRMASGLGRGCKDRSGRSKIPSRKNRDETGEGLRSQEALRSQDR